MTELILQSVVAECSVRKLALFHRVTTHQIMCTLVAVILLLQKFHQEIFFICAVFYQFPGVAVAVLLQVVPRLIDVTQSASRPDLRQYFLQQLASLISTIGVGMKPYMAKLFSLIGVSSVLILLYKYEVSCSDVGMF